MKPIKIEGNEALHMWPEGIDEASTTLAALRLASVAASEPYAGLIAEIADELQTEIDDFTSTTPLGTQEQFNVAVNDRHDGVIVLMSLGLLAKYNGVDSNPLHRGHAIEILDRFNQEFPAS